jgi:hypothetical protein
MCARKGLRLYARNKLPISWLNPRNSGRRFPFRKFNTSSDLKATFKSLVLARVLVWKTFPTQNGQAADYVLGGTTGFSSNYLYSPSSVYSDGIHLYVGDFLNRILIWNTIPTASTLTWDRTLGQSFLNGSSANNDSQSLSSSGFWGSPAVFGDGTRFYVSDQYNDRLLIWSASP